MVARVVFAVSAACALAAGAGVAVPPHEDSADTPAGHDHVLAAYHFGFLLSAAQDPSISPEMARLHRTLARAGVPVDVLSQMPGMEGHGQTPTTLPTIKTAGLSPIQDLAIEFALLIVLAPRLARPTRRLLADLPLPRVICELWRFAPPHMPPRPVVPPYCTA